MPASQASGSAARAAEYRATSGCGRIKKGPSSRDATVSSATASGSTASGSRIARPRSPDADSIGVRTPWGQSACTRTPRPPYVMASHSAKASAACFVTAYGAAPGIVSSPAAETVATKCPRPRSSHSGSTCRAARTCAIVLTCQARSQSASEAAGPPPTPTPALATKRSTPPSASRAARTSATAPSSVAASPGAATPPTDADTACARSASRSLTTTRAPSAASRRAIAAPIPEPAPVTTARIPSTYVIRRGYPAPPSADQGNLRAAAERADFLDRRPGWGRPQTLLDPENVLDLRGRRRGQLGWA